MAYLGKIEEEADYKRFEGTKKCKNKNRLRQNLAFKLLVSHQEDPHDALENKIGRILPYSNKILLFDSIRLLDNNIQLT